MGTKYTSNATEEVLVLDTLIKVLRSAGTLEKNVSDWLLQHQLTITQFGILEALYFSGEMNASLLAHKVLRTCGNITYVLDQLSTRDLISRHKNPEDRREVMVRISAAGKELIQTIFPEHAARMADFFKVLTRSETQKLGALCKTLGRQERSR
jgi:MarR family transcriptional regulator, 2-MHQ and catechol-resistance regulon repressor